MQTEPTCTIQFNLTQDVRHNCKMAALPKEEEPNTKCQDVRLCIIIIETLHRFSFQLCLA